jgi:hypothetical protein
VCAADASSTDAFYVSNITQYFAAWRSVLGASRVIWAYGNPTAVEAAIAGGATIRWGVGTWGYGEGGGPYQMPTSSGADILQSGNTPGPADGTDYNALYAPLSTFAAWGGPSPTPPVVDSQEGSEMEVAVGPTFPSGHLAIVVDNAGDEVARWQSDGTAATETYGIPNQVTTVPKGTPVRIFSDVTLFGSWLKAHDAHQKLINTPQSAVTLTDAQLAKIAAAVKPAVYNVTLTGQSKPI